MLGRALLVLCLGLLVATTAAGDEDAKVAFASGKRQVLSPASLLVGRGGIHVMAEFSLIGQFQLHGVAVVNLDRERLRFNVR